MAISKWKIDYEHSKIAFKATYMMFTKVLGEFRTYSLKVENEDDNFETTSLEFIAEAESIHTFSTERDNHLRSADFFDVEHYKYITFKSNKIKRIYDNYYRITGDFTIKNITKTITLEGEFSGLMKDPSNNIIAAFSLHSKVNRKDFGLTWNAALENGGVLLADDVIIECEVELIKEV